MIWRSVARRLVVIAVIGLFVAPVSGLVGVLTRSPEPTRLWALMVGPAAASFRSGLGVQLSVAGIGTVAMTTAVVAAAYGLSLLKGRTLRVLIVGLIIPMVISGGIIPTYVVVRWLGLIDRPAVLVLAERIDVVMILALHAVFGSEPIRSLREAAAVDGAAPITVMTRVAIPAGAHPVVAVAVLSALRFWNAWFPAFLFVHSPELRPAQNVLRSLAATAGHLRGAESVRGLSAAGEAGIALYALILLLPGLALVFLVRKLVGAALSIRH